MCFGDVFFNKSPIVGTSIPTPVLEVSKTRHKFKQHLKLPDTLWYKKKPIGPKLAMEVVSRCENHPEISKIFQHHVGLPVYFLSKLRSSECKSLHHPEKKTARLDNGTDHK